MVFNDKIHPVIINPKLANLSKNHNKKMKFIYSLLFLLIALGQILIAQNYEPTEHHHQHHKNEIGVANAAVYFVNEREFAYGLHIHYVRSIKETRFGLGLGYERIFDEHKHNTVGIVGSYRPTNRIGIQLSPGITFEDSENSNVNFALHFETSYEFEINAFHIGPVFEFAIDPEDIHLSLGLHIGYGF